MPVSKVVTTWRSRTLIVVLVLGLAAFAVAGCGSNGSNDSSSNTSSAPTRGGSLRIVQPAEISTLAPLKSFLWNEINVMAQISETLFRPTAEGGVEPWLVEKYEKSPDLKEWTLHLRPGIKFSNGMPLTAEDVVFSLEAALKDPNWTPTVEPVKYFEAKSPRTVVMRATAPVPALPSLLAISQMAIQPKDFGGLTAKEFEKNPIGTGPFMVKSWQQGDSVRLARNPSYWREGEPYLDEVVYTNSASDSSRIAQLKSGEADVIALPSFPQIPSLEATSGLNVSLSEGSTSAQLMVNNRNDLLADPRAREAIGLGMDREALTAAATSGLGEPGTSWLSPIVNFFNEDLELPERDVAEARKLLKAAEAATGASGNLTLTYIAGEFWHERASQILQEQLNEVGFDIELQALEIGAWVEEWTTLSYDILLLDATPIVTDPFEYLNAYLVEGWYTDGDLSEVGPVIKDAAQEIDEAERKNLYYEAQRMIAEDGSIQALFYFPKGWVSSDNVIGFSPFPTGQIDLNAVGVSG